MGSAPGALAVSSATKRDARRRAVASAASTSASVAALVFGRSFSTRSTTPPIAMLAGIYYGAQYGGSTTAILVNLPGEVSSVVTCLDGYQMARKGMAGKALGVAALGSFFAGSVATLLIAGFAPPLAELALKFGPADYFSLMVLGLIAAVVLAHGSIIKAIAMIVLGLLTGLIGTDVNSGVARYSFGLPELIDGLGIGTVAMGMGREHRRARPARPHPRG